MNNRVEELCGLLEERGAAYMVNDIPFAGKTVTWFGPTCKWCAIYDEGEGGFAVAVFKDYLSPEQAVEATLGNVDEAVAFRRRVEEAVEEREPLTLFGVDYVAKQQGSRERELENVLRDIVAGEPRCSNRSCGDCEHDEDWECGISRRIRELGVRQRQDTRTMVENVSENCSQYADLGEYNETSDCENDSREKLEADAGELTAYYAASGAVCDALYGGIIRLLDRQAAITEQETKLRELYRFEKNHREHIDSIEEVNRELNRRIAELQAKVDELEVEVGKANAEYERLRSNLGIAFDKAHDILSLANGE